MSTKIINISFLGIDKRSMPAYIFFFKRIKQFSCVLVDDNSQSQICLVDKDAYNIQELYQQFRQNHPNTYILLLSIAEQPNLDDKEFFLKKPVKKDALQTALAQIHLLLSGKTIPVISKNNARKKPPASGDALPENSLSGNSLSKNKDNSNIELTQQKPAITSTINKERKAVTANAGNLLKVVNEKHFVGEQKDININIAEQLPKIYYEPDKFLQAIIEKVYVEFKQSTSIIELKILHYIFYFDFQDYTVCSTVGPGIIRPLCLLPSKGHVSYTVKDTHFRTQLHKIIQANKNTGSQIARERRSWNIDAFMWLITLWSSRGRISQGTSLSHPVYLLQWPNLTRLDPVPHAVRIAALLYEQPHTLIDAAQLLGIEQRYVFAFYSACKSLGLTDISRRQLERKGNGKFDNKQHAPQKNKSILSKLLGKLVGFQNNPKKPDIPQTLADNG